jgi:DNA-directed RNA polymerase specialized sigma24 family protein
LTTSARKAWVLTQEAFDELLEWLNPDRDRAAKKYEDIRDRLIRIFVHRGCMSAEELADKTINKVAKKVHEVKVYYVGDPALYFCGVARNVYAEYRKTLVELPVIEEVLSAPVVEDPDDSELEHKCLERCLSKMSPRDRELLLEYYREEGGAKIEQHQEMSRRLGITVNALRITICRLRASFKKCMHSCVDASPPETNRRFFG